RPALVARGRPARRARLVRRARPICSTASRMGVRSASIGALLAAAALASACGGAAAVPHDAVFEEPPRRAAYLPDDTDPAARDVAAAALGSDRDAAQAQLAAFETTEKLRRAAGEPPTGLDGYVQHVVDATSDDAIAYRHASSELLERRDLDPALRKQ